MKNLKKKPEDQQKQQANHPTVKVGRPLKTKKRFIHDPYADLKEYAQTFPPQV